MLENITSLKVQGGYFVDETDDFPLFQNTINIWTTGKSVWIS